jgi:hypothetical protein
MNETWSVVLVHHNNPTALIRSCLAIRERGMPQVHFHLVDNESASKSFLLAVLFLKALTAKASFFRRPNINREAGGYWYFIDQIYDDSALVFFSQDELHQRGMRPKGVNKRFDTAELPYYTEHYGWGGVCLADCARWLRKAPLDQIGFGGRRCRHSTSSDKRFNSEHWTSRWKHLRLGYYDFFSGACFAMGPEGIKILRKYGQPSEDDLTDPFFPWMWERMWGTIPLFAGGELVHYASKEKWRIDALHDASQPSWDEFNYTKPRHYPRRADVTV